MATAGKAVGTITIRAKAQDDDLFGAEVCVNGPVTHMTATQKAYSGLREKRELALSRLNQGEDLGETVKSFHADLNSLVEDCRKDTYPVDPRSGASRPRWMFEGLPSDLSSDGAHGRLHRHTHRHSHSRTYPNKEDIPTPLAETGPSNTDIDITVSPPDNSSTETLTLTSAMSDMNLTDTQSTETVALTSATSGLNLTDAHC